MADRAARAALSMWDPVHLGVDEAGRQMHIDLHERNLLVGGESGGGKSAALNLLVAHAALSPDCRLWLVDGKQVELGLWRAVADTFVGPDPDAALTALEELRAEMDARYQQLLGAARRKYLRTDRVPLIVFVVDEVAFFSATVGEPRQQRAFSAAIRDIVARGRAAGIISIVATQRPSADIIPTSLRDLFV
jgi:S-DNA-T family DNA segregation ATPase FtsK/SpoIIIE